MAIVFTQGLSETNNLMAYNNNVVRFNSDSLDTSLRADIVINSQTVTIYPTPDGSFYFNFKEYATTIVNQNNFVDSVNPELDASDSATYTYAGTGFVIAEVDYIIYLAEDTTDTISKEYRFLAGVEQLETYKRNEIQLGQVIVLLPLFPKTANKYYAKYWEGYPFDISFLSASYPDLDDDLLLTNNTNLLDYLFERKAKNTRLFFCDGSIDQTITDFLPLAIGRNEIAWQDKFIYIDTQDTCGGVYLKWFNQYGGYSYWLFPNFPQRNQSQKAIGEISTDTEDLADTFSQNTIIGMSAGERLTVNSDKLTEEEFNLLRGVLISPKVYLFTGEPFSQADSNDWMEVKVMTPSQRTRNAKGQALDITIDIELPDFYTQTL